MYRDHQIGPSASLMMDNVNIIIYPIEYTKTAYAEHWKQGQSKLVSTRGRVVDHVAFSVDNLKEYIDRLQQDGVKILEPVRKEKLIHAFIEGPDSIVIELMERQPVKN
jgi:hypothetical protein